MPITTVLLDLDGTLVDTNGYHVQSYVRAFETLGFEVASEDIKRQVGKGGDKLVAALIGEEDSERHGDAIRQQAATLFTDVLARDHTFAFFDGAQLLVEELNRRGLRTAIATSSDEEFLDAIFASAGEDLRERVDAITTKSDVEASKPEADVLEAALDRLDARAEEAVLIGDTIYDFEAASRAGVRGIGVTTWVWSADDLRRAGASRVYPDLTALLADLDEVLQ